MAVTQAGVSDHLSLRDRRRRLIRRAASAVVSVLVVLAVFWYFLPQYTDVSQVWRFIREMSPAEIGLLAAAAAWNLATYGFVLVSSMPGLTYPQAMVVTESSTAVSNTLPGGAAVGIAMSYSMYSSWGFSKSRSTVSLLVAGIWNNFAKLGMPILALALLALQQSPSTGRIAAGAVGLGSLAAAVGLFAVLLRSEEWADRFGDAAARGVSRVLRVLRRPAVSGWDDALRTFRRRTVGLVTARWRSLTLTTVVSHASLFVVLLVALRAVGVPESDVGWAEALVVFTFARLVTAIPVTPGGLGIVEVALITGMAAAGGARAQVAAAVLLFRALTYLLPVPLGVLTYAFWRRNRSWRRAPGTAPRPPGLHLEQVP